MQFHLIVLVLQDYQFDVAQVLPLLSYILILTLALCLHPLSLLPPHVLPLLLFRTVTILTIAPLKCCSGWHNGKLTLENYINSLDICFIQEHWLFDDSLNLVREIDPDFISVGVSGMKCDFVCRGRPFGGCSILYRRCLSSCISPLHSCSDRFCGVKLSDKNGLTYLLVSLYMPTFYDPSSCDNYLNVLGELEAFIGSNHCDINVIVGDFNVDFDRGGLFAKLLKDFMSELDLCVCDLGFSSSVKYTYEHDDSLSRSWLDHVLCSKRFSNLFSDFHAIHSPSIHSDHFPLFFNIDITCTIIPHMQSHSVHRKQRILWSKASLADIDRYCHMVSSTIPELPPEVFTCVVPNCIEHP